MGECPQKGVEYDVQLFPDILGKESQHKIAVFLKQLVLSAIAAVGAVIVTKDEDFVVREMLESGPAVVWVRIGNTRRADLLRRLEAHFASILNALERGETLVEIV
jgi:hypothetical protein